MVKNLPTVERSTKIRFGKNATEDQGENTIVFNASNVQIDTTQPGSVYISPLRQVLDVSDRQIKILTYNRISKEITDSGVAAVDVLQPNLQATTNLGNTTTNTIEFTNPETGFVTTANVGIANSLPVHTLDVGSNLYVDDVGSNVLVVNGNTNIRGDIVVQGNAQIDGVLTVINTENLTITDAIIELGRNNTVGDTTLDLGIIMNRPNSNVTVGFLEGVDELALAYTQTSADSKTITPLTSETLDVHVYGRVLTESNVGIMNTSPIHTLDVGSNLFVDEYGSNVLVVSGNASISGDLTVDEDTFHVDVGGKSIGLGTVTPDANLHVIGNVYVSSNLTVDEDTLHVDATTNSVGIETKNPQANLHVVGNVYVSSNLTVDEDTLHVDATTNSVGIETKNPQANLHVVGNVYVSSNLTVDEDTLHVDATTHSVGVETKNPSANLHVVGNVYVSSNLTVDDDTLHVDALTHSVGIETKGPDANLHVVGNVYASSNLTTDGTLTLNHPTTALITDLTSNVEVKLNQLANVVLGEKALANEDMLVYDGSNWTNQLQNHTFLYAKAEETIDKGDAVFATGTIGNNTFSIRKAQANLSATMPALGLAYQDFALNDQGLIVTFGRADGINTDNFQTGETVYVSNVTAGALSNVKPYGSGDLIQNIGLVVKGHPSTGIVSVTGVGRSNDIPNAPIVADEGDINYVYVNDNNNDLKKILPTNLLTQLQTLQQVTDTGNTISNTIQFTDVTTGLVTVANVEVGSNISVAGLIDAVNKHVPMVGTDGFLEKSPIYFTPGGTYVVSAAEAEFLGNLTLSGNTTILNSESVTISDRIFGVAANNSASQLDSGFMIEHQEGDPLEYANVALIYHADEHRFSISYTQNTFTDDHILHYEDETHRMLIDLIGNVEVQHNLVVNETVDVTGTTSLANDLTVGAASNLFVDVSTSRVGINEASPSASLDVGGDVNIQSVVGATSKTTGALVVAGGVGVGGDVYASSTVLSGDLTVDTDTLIVNSTTDRVGINKAVPTVALDVVGDVVISDDFTVDTDTLRVDAVTDRVGINVLAPDASLHVVGNAHVQNTTEAFSTVTGAMTIAGGLGVTANVHATQFHGDGSKLTGLVTTLEDVANNGNTMSNVIIFENETTGLVTDGRIGVSTRVPDANLHVVGNVHVADTTEAFSVTTGAATITGGLGVTGNVHAAQFHVDGSQLTGLVTTLEDVANNGNTMSNVIIFENSTTGLVTDGQVGVSTRTPDANLHVVGNVYMSNVLTVAGGMVTNKDQVAKKTYSYSGTITAGDQPFINVNFTSHIFYSKISAQLVDGDEELSTMILEVSGGSKSGVSPSKNVAIGTKNVFGDPDNGNPWDTSVLTTGNRVAIRPSGSLGTTGEYHIFMEYMSAHPDGQVPTIDEDSTSVITFGY